MEKRTCKLCFRTFSNGRALGGHMRSHVLKLQAATTTSPFHPQKTKLIDQLDDETDSASSYSSSEEDDKGLSYELRENPRKSFRVVDPVFASFAVDAGSVVQDWESETESSKNPSRIRSKLTRKSDKSGLTQLPDHLRNQDHGIMKMPLEAESLIEQEPISSLSGTTSDEDVAFCLMMLSRGIRTRKTVDLGKEDGEESVEESDEELEEIKIRVKSRRSKYQCETCKKFFRSYQALGGHRASHKKIKACNSTPSSSSSLQTSYEQEGILSKSTNMIGKRIHECPVCFRVFSSGQALGGHKRSHLTGSSSTLPPIRNSTTNSTRFGNYLIDLNLPAPMDDDDQIEHSAVLDRESADPIM